MQQKRKEEGPQRSNDLRRSGGRRDRFSAARSPAPVRMRRRRMRAAGSSKARESGRRRRIRIRRRWRRSAWTKRPGEVTVHKIWAAHDCGRALNPVSVEGQVIGSVWMGLGQALQEEMVWKDGLLMNPGMLEYRSPSSAESPEIEMIHRREHRSGRSVWREGSERRIAGRDDSGDRERDLRRGRHAVARSAVHAGARAGRAAREKGREEDAT